MRVLAIAFAIRPEGGSEYAVGWTWVTQIARVADEVVVLVRDAEGQREAIERYCESKPLGNVRFIYYELPGRLRNIVKGEIHTGQRGMRRYYLVWQLFAVFHLRSNLDLGRFDIVHHVTFENDWLPSFFTLLGIRCVVLGPMGSHSFLPYKLGYPPGLLAKDYVANTIKWICRWLNPLFRYNMMRADALIGISNETRRKIATKYAGYKFYRIPGVSAPEELAPDADSFPKRVAAGTQVLVFSACPFIYWKNYDLAIEAFAEYRCRYRDDAIFAIAGEGPLRASLEALAHRLGVSDHVRFLGWVPAREVHRIMRADAHVFLFPTAECGGTVSVEALRCGVPVVCLKGYGLSYFLGAGKGVTAVSVRSRAQVVRDLADGINRTIENLSEYSEAAYAASDEFVPDKKRLLIRSVYAEALARRQAHRARGRGSRSQ